MKLKKILLFLLEILLVIFIWLGATISGNICISFILGTPSIPHAYIKYGLNFLVPSLISYFSFRYIELWVLRNGYVSAIKEKFVFIIIWVILCVNTLAMICLITGGLWIFYIYYWPFFGVSMIFPIWGVFLRGWTPFLKMVFLLSLICNVVPSLQSIFSFWLPPFFVM